MEIRHIKSWNEFENEIKALPQSHFLFRGQSNAEWPLKTTVERVIGDKLGMGSYHGLISQVKGRIESFTGNNWEIPDETKYYEWLTKSRYIADKLPAYEYMVYLRHHGFPSPLLDWSMSPFVAAYFAFRDLSNNTDSVAIFAYVEIPDEAKFISTTDANIISLTPDIRSDQRHFLQQSTYTICIAGEKEKTYYCSHEEVFKRGEPRQDLLWKFILPSTERKNALKKLDAYNINAYSIFQSEDSLMETVFLREYSQYSRFF